MRNKKLLVICVAIITAAGLWFWRYRFMNTYYDGFSNITPVVYSEGETVAFGQNRTNEGMIVDGYSIRVDDMEIIEFADFVSSWGIDPDKLQVHPERVALVYVTLFNDACDEPILLPGLELHGLDNYVGMNWDILWAVNPQLVGYTSIQLAHGHEYQLILPYSLSRTFFSSRTWDHINEYRWMLRITYWPEQIDIAVTPNE